MTRRSNMWSLSPAGFHARLTTKRDTSLVHLLPRASRFLLQDHSVVTISSEWFESLRARASKELQHIEFATTGCRLPAPPDIYTVISFRFHHPRACFTRAGQPCHESLLVR